MCWWIKYKPNGKRGQELYVGLEIGKLHPLDRESKDAKPSFKH